MDDDDKEALRKDLASRALNACCDSCGAVNWGIQEGTYALVADVESGSPDLENALRVQVLLCHRCGFVRLYSTLIDWHVDASS